MKIVNLSTSEADSIKKALPKVIDYHYSETKEFFEASKQMLFPKKLIDALKELKSNISNVLLIDGLPIDTRLNKNYTKDTSIAECILLRATYALGKPFINHDNYQNNIINDIYPISENSHKQIGSSSEALLLWHTEAAHARMPPKYIILFCLRGNESAFTKCATFNLNDFKSQQIKELNSNFAVIKSDDSYSKQIENRYKVFTKKKNSFCLRYDPIYTQSKHIKFLEELYTYFNNNHTKIALKPGQMLIINNHTCVHARSSYTSKYDGMDRWLKRIMVHST